MREIKFRAWEPDTKKMVDVYGVNPMVQKVHLSHQQLFGTAGDDLLLSYSPDGEYSYVRLMQYTGLTDRNGVEIYEGDIVKDLTTKTYLGSKKITARKGQVKYGDYYAASDDPYCYADVTGFYIDGDVFSSNLKDYSEKELEVIGNIYQHGHLLENESKE